jgi:hypothetical protein
LQLFAIIDLVKTSDLFAIVALVTTNDLFAVIDVFMINADSASVDSISRQLCLTFSLFVPPSVRQDEDGGAILWLPDRRIAI